MTITHNTPAAALKFDLLAPHLLDDPYPLYAEVRQAPSAYYTWPGSEVPVPVLGRYADVQIVLRDSRFGRAGFRKGMDSTFGDVPITRAFGHWMLFQDPPDHTRLRGLVSKAFTPRAVEILRGEIDAIVARLLDGVRGKSTFDLMAEVAYPLPVLVICELLGVPEADRDRLGVWSAALAEALDNLTMHDPEVLARCNAAATGLTEYFRDLVRIRRSAPRDDFLSGLIAVEEQGDRLTEDELLGTCVLLFFAGHETTVNLIGNGTLALLRHPAELERLRAEPALLPNAVEELLRYDSPVQRTGRTVLEEVEIGGHVLQAGYRVNLLLGAANRDPSQFSDPDRLDVTRPNASQHLSFASGMHYCVGAPLARLEAQLAIGALLRRFSDLRLAIDAPAWRRTFVLRGLTALPVSV
jgi:pimeloyl-[acyl-carrier protein] synthase